ncbi:MAG: ABC transporter permease [Bacteroides sp.]|nr:ABC transporter permease [Bacteroides sp.]
MKRYFQQTLYQLRNQPLLSGITILGTALAIALIMVILIVYHAKTADYAPEVNRSRTLYVKWTRTVNTKKKNNANHSRSALWLVKELFYNLKTPEAVSATYEMGDVLVASPGSNEDMNIPMLLTDPGFWKLHQFRFLAGKPFNEEQFQAGALQAVIAESVAGRIFGGTDEAVGKTLMVNFTAYTVCGVVEDVNRFCEMAYSQIYAPYTSNQAVSQVRAGQTSGNYLVMMLAPSGDDFPTLRAEVEREVARINTMIGDNELQLMGQPDDFRTQLMRKFANQYEDLDRPYWQYGIMIAVILLVPAINLSGLTNTRMRRRLEELGLRKAFGATRSSLVTQVMNENLILTVLGGLLGLLLAYLAIWLMGSWLLQTSWGSVATMNVSMISPQIFLIAFGFCLLLNLLSAYLPARKVAYTPIVESLNHKL